MRRRTVLAGLGLGSISGCLQFTGECAQEDTDADGSRRGSDAGSGTQSAGDTGENSGAGDVVTMSREDAITRASSFAAADAAPLGTYDGDGPRFVTFSTNAAGSSAGNGPQDSIFTSTDLIVDPLDQERLQFGGDTGRSVRVRNLATDSTLTLEPTRDTSTYAAGSIEIETEGNGVFESLTLGTPDAEENDVDLDVMLTGDESLFQAQAFATYVVELLDSDGASIGETAGRIFGKGYQWALAQTSSTAFLTRHPSVQADWYVQFKLDETDADPLPVANTADTSVFEIDLTQIDVDPGVYDWTLTIGRSQSAVQGRGTDGLIRLRSGIGPAVIVE